MTYCLGFKTDNAAFVVADAVGTIRGGDVALINPVSSFGETHIARDDRIVEERCLKVMNFKVATFAFAGDYHRGQPFAEAYQAALKAGLPPEVAFQRAANSIVPLPTNKALRAVTAFFDGSPRLFSFNARGDQGIHEEEKIVQLGSLPDDSTAFRFSESLGHYVAEHRHGMSPLNLLVGALGVCQSYCIHDGLLDRGVGGAFSGQVAMKDGVRWQPDIEYVKYSSQKLRGEAPGEPGDATAVVVRGDTLFTASWDGKPRLQGINYRLSTESDAEFGARTKKGKEEFLRFVERGEVAYTTLLDVDQRSIVVVEMPRGRLHKYLARRQTPSGMEIGYTVSLARAMIDPPAPDMPLMLQFFPPTPLTEVGPNKPCPCGRGAKFKRCHGRGLGAGRR